MLREQQSLIFIFFRKDHRKDPVFTICFLTGGSRLCSLRYWPNNIPICRHGTETPLSWELGKQPHPQEPPDTKHEAELLMEPCSCQQLPRLAPEAVMPSAAQFRKLADFGGTTKAHQGRSWEGDPPGSQKSHVFICGQTQYWASETEQMLCSLSLFSSDKAELLPFIGRYLRVLEGWVSWLCPSSKSSVISRLNCPERSQPASLKFHSFSQNIFFLCRFK